MFVKRRSGIRGERPRADLRLAVDEEVHEVNQVLWCSVVHHLVLYIAQGGVLCERVLHFVNWLISARVLGAAQHSEAGTGGMH
jgi:hypothetical protein